MKTHTHVKDIYRLEDVINKQEKDHEFKILLDKSQIEVAIARQIKIARERSRTLTIRTRRCPRHKPAHDRAVLRGLKAIACTALNYWQRLPL